MVVPDRNCHDGMKSDTNIMSCKRCTTPIHPCHTAAILPRGTKKAMFYHAKPHPRVSIARLSVVKQSSFRLPGQYGRRVTRVNSGTSRQAVVDWNKIDACVVFLNIRHS